MTRLRKTSDGRMPIKATLLAEKQKGAVSITVSSTEGWRKGKRQDFTLCKYDADKKVVPGSVTAWTGVPGDNNTIDSLELVGGNDQLYPIGSSVVAGPTSKWADDLIDAMLEHHDEEGRLKEKTVALNNINGGPSAGVLQADDNGTVTSGKIKASNIDLASLKVNPKFMQTGAFVMTRKANGAGAGSKVVTFDTPFDRPPVVVLTGDAGDAYASVAYLAGTPTTTSFTALYRITTSGGDAQKVVHYTAIDSQAPVLTTS